MSRKVLQDAAVSTDSDPNLRLRRTRQRTKEAMESALPLSIAQGAIAFAADAVTNAISEITWCSASIKTLPIMISSDMTTLDQSSIALLHAKQHQLNHSKLQKSFRNSKLANAVAATLVFAQEEAGTAVCISPRGILLTCSHCVAESPKELKKAKCKWLLFASGQIVEAECIAWDPKRDLALLQIIAAQPPLHPPDPQASENSNNVSYSFPFISTADAPPPLRAALICVGHPGSEDLEATQPGVKTDYDVLHVSSGIFRGCAPGLDLQNNSDIGALQHDCWTYWGHSGAPLVHRATGQLVGLHSSWDANNGMRRGVPLEAIQEFLQHQKALLRAGEFLGVDT